jgi:predicted GH43/DUF377 family glycosyl hydrolase
MNRNRKIVAVTVGLIVAAITIYWLYFRKRDHLINAARYNFVENFKYTPPDAFKIFNPSVTKINNNYYFSIRESNAHGMSIFWPKTIINRTVMVKTDKKFAPIKLKVINFDDITVSNDPETQVNICNKDGVEDIRLFTDNIDLWGIGNIIVPVPGEKCLNRMVLIKFDKDSLLPKQYIKLDYGPNDSPQKNWSPVDGDEHFLTFIYSWDPYIVLKVDLSKEPMVKSVYKESIEQMRKRGVAGADNIKNNRGGTQLVPYKNGYITITHRRSRGNYHHHIVMLDSNLKVMSVSKKICLDLKGDFCGVEFASGLTIKGDTAVITYGDDSDREAKYVTVSMDKLLNVAGQK